MREFVNAETNQLGIALPTGKLRFYRRDDDGQLQFVGENTIDHTPRNETIRVTTGNSFDLVGERKQTNFRVDTGDKWMDETFEIKLRNRKKDAGGNPRGRASLPLEQLGHHRQVRRLHEERRADHRVPHAGQARRGTDGDLHRALFVVIPGSAGFQPASGTAEGHQRAGKMPALPVLAPIDRRSFALLQGQFVFTRANPAFTGFSST